MFNWFRQTLILISLSLSFLLSSCSEPSHPDADAICDCYNVVHHIYNDDELIEIVSDSCNQLYIETLKKLEKDKEELVKFRKAYNVCR